MDDTDTLTPQDLADLRNAHEHLVSIGDPRADKLGAYLSARTGFVPGPPPQTRPVPFGLQQDRSTTETISNRPDAWGEKILPVNNLSGEGLMDMASGHPVRGTLKALTPFALATPLGEVGAEGLAQGVENLPRLLRGAVRGGAEAFTTGRSSIPAAMGATIGHFIGGPQGAEIGASLGALPGTLQGIYRGIHSEFNPIPVRTTAAPPPLQGSSLERLEPPNQPRYSVPPLQGSSLERTTAPTPPKIVPPSLQGSSLERMTPPANPKIAPPPLQGSSLQRAGVDDGEEGIQPVLPPTDRVELNRMLHAKVQRLNLPGSPAGERSPGFLTSTAQKEFGSSYDKLNLNQLRELYDRLDKYSQ